MPSSKKRAATIVSVTIRQLHAAFFSPSGNNSGADIVRKRPSNLLYDVDETPPLLVRLGVSFQHVFLLSVGWLYVVVIVNSIGGTEAQAESIIRISMIAGGLATILQSTRGAFGSGYFAPLTSSLIFLCPFQSWCASRGVSTAFRHGCCGRDSAEFNVPGFGPGPGFVSSRSNRANGGHGRAAVNPLGMSEVRRLQRTWNCSGVARVCGRSCNTCVMVGATVWNKGKLHALPMLLGLSAGYILALGSGVVPWAQVLLCAS